MRATFRTTQARYSKRPGPIKVHKVRYCEYEYPVGVVCGARTGNGGANYKYCDLHHRALSNTAGLEGV